MVILLLALASLILTAPPSEASSPLPVRSASPSMRPSARPSRPVLLASPSPTSLFQDDDEILKNIDFYSYMDAAEHQGLSDAEPGDDEEEDE